MYWFTATYTPRLTCASVHATTSTMRSARQAMVSFRDVSASQIRLVRSVRGIEAQAPQQVVEVGPGGFDLRLVAQHLDEPGAAVRLEQRRDHARLLRAFAGELVDGE